MKKIKKKRRNKVITKQVKSRSGHVFRVDISDEACGKFGFKHDDHIIDGDGAGSTGVVMGVARSSEWDDCGPEVLWYALDHFDDGKVCYSHPFHEGILRLL